MPKNSFKSCSFCLKLEGEVDELIDTRTNSLIVNEELLEFQTIFKDLLNFQVRNIFKDYFMH